MSRQTAYGVLAAFIVIVLTIAFVIFSGSSLPGADTLSAPQEKEAPPPPSEAVKAQLRHSKGFRALVSYTDRGFEPREVALKEGETVRFTNNSSGTVWIASTGGPSAYPGQSECGSSAFDTCRELQRGEFWEFTFDAKGTWRYRNNPDTSKTGVVIVE